MVNKIIFSFADASYVDPLGPQMERPKTGAKKRGEDDDFADEELGDDLLPEWQLRPSALFTELLEHFLLLLPFQRQEHNVSPQNQIT